jgi:hypothetical protein
MPRVGPYDLSSKRVIPVSDAYTALYLVLAKLRKDLHLLALEAASGDRLYKTNLREVYRPFGRTEGFLFSELWIADPKGVPKPLIVTTADDTSGGGSKTWNNQVLLEIAGELNLRTLPQSSERSRGEYKYSKRFN